MKTTRQSLPVILPLIFIFSVVSSLSAQDCGSCPKRHVIVYDFDVQVPRPGDPAKTIQWQQLFGLFSLLLYQISFMIIVCFFHSLN